MLQRSPGYHVSGMIDPGFSLDVTVMPSAATGTVTSHGVTWQMLAIGESLWFRGRALWQATLPAARAAELGDGWVLVTDPSAAFGYAHALRRLHDAIAAIVFGPHPGLAVSGHARVAGRSAVELRSRTDTYDVADDGSDQPLRWLDSDIPGAGGQPCGITLDRFGATVAATPPAQVAATVTPGP